LAGSFPDGLDALLVTAPENVRYLSGFTGSNGSLLISRTGDATLATDGRYLIQAAQEAGQVECIEARAVGPALAARAAAAGHARIGFEPHAVTVALHGQLVDAATPATLVPAPRLVEALRVVKDAGELAALAAACQITDAAFDEVVLSARLGGTERELAFALSAAMRRLGAEADAFDPIVAFGPNSAIPHHSPTDRPLQTGDFLKTDFGARYAGYHADMTRTVVMGPAADWQRELYQAVHTIQADGRSAIAVGALPAELDAAARQAIQSAGHQAQHGLGHGVGLLIHEDPFLTPSGAEELAADMVVTVEPGIYLEGRGGVRIEDTVHVTADGGTVLTKTSRELVEI
jgi:Xaa-Pro aminopeptidase